jgi:hypothetical protein
MDESIFVKIPWGPNWSSEIARFESCLCGRLNVTAEGRSCGTRIRYTCVETQQIDCGWIKVYSDLPVRCLSFLREELRYRYREYRYASTAAGTELHYTERGRRLRDRLGENGWLLRQSATVSPDPNWWP